MRRDKKKTVVKTVFIRHTGNDVLFDGFLHKVAEFCVKVVGLLQDLFAQTIEVGFPASFNLFCVNLVHKVVVKVHGLFVKSQEFLVRSVRVNHGKNVAVLYEGAHYILDVFLDVSKIHSVLY